MVQLVDLQCIYAFKIKIVRTLLLQQVYGYDTLVK